jgi:hypothetical protein
MVIISIGEWLLDHKVKVSARSAPRPFCSAKPSGLWRSLHLEEQESSYEAQVRYYTELILARQDWTLAGHNGPDFSKDGSFFYAKIRPKPDLSKH